jgi:hypothetical protein
MGARLAYFVIIGDEMHNWGWHFHKAKWND